MSTSDHPPLDPLLAQLRADREGHPAPTLEGLEALASDALSDEERARVEEALRWHPEYLSLLERLRTPDPRRQGIAQAALEEAITRQEREGRSGRVIPLFGRRALAFAGSALAIAAALLLVLLPLPPDPAPSAFSPIPQTRSEGADLPLWTPGTKRRISPAAPERFTHYLLFDLHSSGAIPLSPAARGRPWTPFVLEAGAEAGVHQLLLIYSERDLEVGSVQTRLDSALRQPPPLHSQPADTQQRRLLDALGSKAGTLRLEIDDPYLEVRQ